MLIVYLLAFFMAWVDLLGGQDDNARFLVDLLVVAGCSAMYAECLRPPGDP